MTFDHLRAALDQCADHGRPAQFWLRDDDAVMPTPALDRLLDIAGAAIPLTLAVIPAHSGPALADRLEGTANVTVAPHGWSHTNHAAAGEKSQELGGHRPAAVVLAELATGFGRLTALHGSRFLPMLVPPWNRIDAAVVAGLPDIGFQALSVFGPDRPGPVAMLNTHVDLIDWRGTRGGRDDAPLIADILARIATGAPVGLLTHHLVHDAAAWGFLSRLIDATIGHAGCRWVSARALLR